MKLILKRLKRQVGSDKERPTGRVGSGSDNGEVGTIPNHNPGYKS